MKETRRQTEACLKRLLRTIQKLRSPNGCLWDRRQKKEDMAKYILEETYELIDAIEDGSPAAIKEEMGDLLFQIFFLAHISEEAGDFNLPDIMDDVNEKMIRRHPHVFGNTDVKNVEEIKNNWEDIKRNMEKRNENGRGLFDNIPRSMPALMRAQKVTEAASKVGFDWARTEEVLAKIEEELDEFKSSLTADDSKMYQGRNWRSSLFSGKYIKVCECKCRGIAHGIHCEIHRQILIHSRKTCGTGQRPCWRITQRDG